MDKTAGVCVVVLVILLGEHKLAIAGDPCEVAIPNPRVSLVLKTARLSQEGRFFGTFELSNKGLDRPLILPGRRDGGTFLMEIPDVTVQYLDLNSQWVSFSTLAGSFIAPPDRLEVKVHSRGILTTDVVSQEIANRSASDFRILIRLFQPDMCVVSSPFHAIPPRQPVTGFEPGI